MGTLSHPLRHAIPLSGGADDYVPLLDRIGDARLVLLGEASHGTHEFYRERARITQQLIIKKGFHAVAVEADWPDAYRVNQWLRQAGTDTDAEEALGGFKRFPTWMWRNAEVLDFLGWARAHNESLPLSPASLPIGFFGLDLYSLYASIDAVLGYLEKTDPEAAKRARARYACFEQFGEDTQIYGLSTGLGMKPSCEREVLDQLLELEQRAVDGEELFSVEQNARLVKNAEEYYRTMFTGRVASWNLRDQHMVETLDALDGHLASQVDRPKIVVWEHNSHLGDARATEMGQSGEWNVGQLVRERHGEESFLVGFTTYDGTVTAASDWGEPAERKRVRPAIAGSYEALFHSRGLERFLALRDVSAGHAGLLPDLPREALERAIGVIYRPETERQSHYFRARITEQFDAVIHIDRSRAVEPLERSSQWIAGEVPETYPFTV
jgi:erythromycin esterase-like protein